MKHEFTCNQCAAVLFRTGDVREVNSRRALAALASSIETAFAAVRLLPELPVESGFQPEAARRMLQDVQFHSTAAGRSLGRAYDCLSTLAKIINES